MNRGECQKLVDSYLDWLRASISVEEVQGACELTTPFLDRHNDHLQIYLTKSNGNITISDDGYILSDLRTSGLDLATPKRKAVLSAVLNGFGVRSDGRQLSVDASQKNLPQRLHSLMQAMLAVNDMFVMAQPRVVGFFWEDVREFLDVHDVRYSPRVKVSGKSGFDHAIDFLIPKSKSRPERLVQAINAPSKNSIGTYLWVLSDTREGRGDKSEAYAFLNDRDGKISGDVIDALRAYEVVPALWSQRESVVLQLSS